MIDQTNTIGERAQRPVNLMPFGIGAALFLILFVGGTALGGEAGQFMLASLNALPFAVLAVFAYLGGQRPNWAWVVASLWLAVMIGGASLVSLGFSLITLLAQPLEPESAPQLAGGAWLQMGLVLLLVIVSIGLAAALLAPALRRSIARRLPLDPDSFVHTVALVAVVSLGLICTVPLVVLGQPPLLALVDQLGEGALGRDSNGLLRDQLYSLVWTVPAGLLAVGFGVQRSFRQALQRLGLVRPSLKQVGAAVGIALLLVGAVQLVGFGIDWLWGVLGWPKTDGEAFNELLSFAISPIGALVIGITAGLGEELAVRGVLQPRLGLVLSNLFFMSLHALQYNWDALLVVFLVGMVCGLVRQRSNTSTAAIVHGSYNFTLIMLATLGIGS